MNVSRRRLLWGSAVVGGGLVIGVSWLRGGATAPAMIPVEGGFEPNAFLQITPESVVRFYCPRDEMGQGVTTGLATLVAEDLDVDPQRIEVALVGAHAAYENPAFGIQATGGSTSVRAHYRPLREASASVRAMLLEAAAIDLGVPSHTLRTDDGHIVHAGERLPYGRFVATARRLELPGAVPLRGRQDFKHIGRDFPRLDGLAKSTGTAIFGIDVVVPGMHYAVVKHAPVAGGSPRSFDREAVLAMPGVTDVVAIKGGVAAVAGKFWQAKQAADTLEVAWDLPALAAYGSQELEADYRSALERDAGESTEARGDVTEALARGEHVVERTYWAPFLAHAPMEPMNAVVRIEGGEADVWTGSQSPAGAAGLVARTAGIPRDRVRVHGTYLGGGFGRRGTLTHVVEAAEVALAAGKPIKLLWTREDDIRSGHLRPASLMRIRAALDPQGTISAWEAKRVGANIGPWALDSALPGLLPGAVPQWAIDAMVGAADRVLEGFVVDHSSIEGLYEDYDFPNREIRHVTRSHGLPLTYWRSVGHSYTAFAKESAIDELAHQAGMDAVELRLRNTRGNPRLHQVIGLAAERMRTMAPPSGHALGFAAHGSFGSFVAQVAEVSVADGRIRVHRVVCAVDCGLVVNPDIVRAQMEGGIAYGLTAALHGRLDIDGGAVRQSNFHDYPILRMHEAPAVEVILVASDADPSGVGEPGLPPIAPAVANAVFAATGKRLRSLPLELA